MSRNSRPLPHPRARNAAVSGLALLGLATFTTFATPAMAAAGAFQIEEATVESIHAAIQSGATTCRDVVQAYIDRAKAYNGVCTALVTPDGTDIAPAKGYVRAGRPLLFPTQTVKASKVLPQLDQYRGLPLDYGRMEPTVSDPGVMAQMGMRVGIADAGQVNALETLNIRGERSVTCKGAFDASPGIPLPAGAPAVCEEFRKQRDALETAAALDAKYGRQPDLAALPMYCVVTAIKDPYDTRDMRTTANNDVAFAMDAPPSDSTVVARLRAHGAIIYAKSVAHEFNGGPGNPAGGAVKAKTNLVAGGQGMGAWAGQPCNPYDTTRVTRGSSSGSGAAVSANLVTIGICEQSGASCQGPASRNGIATLLTTKGVLPDNGGIGYQWFNDRAGIHARTLADAARVLDALKDPASAAYDDIRDPFAAVPKALIPAQPYASFIVDDAALRKNGRPLAGMRIAILREHMVKKTHNHEAISDQIDREIKSVLRDRLGAELVETTTPDYPDDPDVPNLRYTFSDALAELLPRLMPEIFSRRDKNGKLYFDVPGYDVTSADYLLKLSRHEAPLTRAIDITNFANFAATPCVSQLCADFAFDINRYLADRGDARIRTWADWVANAKFREDKSRAGAENWVAFKDHEEAGKADRLARSTIARLALLKVMHENRIDAFVHPENTVPTPKILGPNVGTISLDGITPFFQIPRVVIPAGFSDVVYEPQYALNADHTDYISVLAPDTKKTKLAHPLPISITFFAGQGEEPALIRIGTAYESATHHRKPPPDFGPLADKR
ncbi:amidase family protein [Solimonas soli]|uniref:amidase family protein n=1 Tax=Solimonas soli TaxID=413479 RepID=UPI00146FC205|nr:amidase family protein [Solimonas soli]